VRACVCVRAFHWSFPLSGQSKDTLAGVTGWFGEGGGMPLRQARQRHPFLCRHRSHVNRACHGFLLRGSGDCPTAVSGCSPPAICLPLFSTRLECQPATVIVFLEAGVPVLVMVSVCEWVCRRVLASCHACPPELMYATTTVVCVCVRGAHVHHAACKCCS